MGYPVKFQKIRFDCKRLLVMIHSSVPNSLTFFRPLTLAYVRHEGAAALSVPAAWRELRKRISAFALEIGGPLATYGLFHRPQLSTSAHQQSFDACIEVPPALEQAVRGSLAIQQLSGGVYIGSGALDSHRQLDAAIESLSADPLITHGLTVDAERPVIICYTQKSAAKNRHWNLTVNAPLCWASDGISRAA